MTALLERQHILSPFRQAIVDRTESGVLTVAGWIVTYGERNQNGNLWVPGAGAASLQERLDTGRKLTMGYQHHWGEALTVIGAWNDWQVSKKGIYATGRVSDTSRGRDAATLLEDEAIDGISVGFHAEYDQIRYLGPGDVLDVETPFGPFHYKAEEWTLVFVEADISEASIVHDPADENAMVVELLQKASRAMPALVDAETWDDVAYSMALLMGGRGHAQAFEDVPIMERFGLYRKLADAYQAHGKTPPAYTPAPVYKDVAFQHDEREVFSDRYLRKSLATVVASAGGFEGQLSPETREQADSAIDALQALTRHQGATLADRLRQTNERFSAAIESLEQES